jgi:hypothetical protein
MNCECVIKKMKILIELFLFKEYNPHTMAEDEVKLLHIKKLQRNDTGAYLCRVLNEYGYADLIHKLIVLPGKLFIYLIKIKFLFLLRI